MKLVVNSRVASGVVGGQQRVAIEVGNRLKNFEFIQPERHLSGIKGHVWEQVVLPLKAKGAWLWSPSTSGPVMYRNQIVTIHDVAFFDVPEYFSGNFGRFYRNTVPLLARSARKIVTVSEFSRDRISETTGVEKRDISVIYNGISSCFRPYREEEIRSTRERLGIGPLYIMLQATSDRRKNLGRALEAWASVTDALGPDVKLVVAGAQGRAHVFGASEGAQSVNNCHFLGYVPDSDLAPLMAGALCFLFPSLYEGFGLPIVEAMASGVPVITSDRTATAEIGSGAAYLVDPYSTASIADAIKAVVQSSGLREELSGKGLERARHFSWDEAASQYNDVFSSYTGS